MSPTADDDREAPSSEEATGPSVAPSSDVTAHGSIARARSAAGFLARLPALVPNGAPSLHVGVDENGVGPLLGPLVVTAVAFRTTGPRPGRGALGPLVADSKALVAHGDVALGEAWARALLASIGEAPKSPAELIARLSLDDAPTLRAPCPREPDVGSMCWGADLPFHADDALVGRCLRAVRGWSGARDGARFVRRTPLELLGVRTSIVCASRLNAARAAGRHVFLVDLHEMERLSLALHRDAVARLGAEAVGPIDAVCGKVGGMDYYGDYFGPLSGRLRAIEAEGGLASSYRFPQLGRFTFLQDADAGDPLVGLASLVGKYVREILMARIVRWMRAGSSIDVEQASGYRDPTTRRFIVASKLVRSERGVPDRCFRRDASAANVEGNAEATAPNVAAGGVSNL